MVTTENFFYLYGGIMHITIYTKVKVIAAFLLTYLFSYTAAADKVEVLHWWTSKGSEEKAIGSLKSDLAKRGIGWQDMPIVGGGGGNSTTVLRARVSGGNPPTSAALLGYAITDWAKTEGALANLNDIAEKQNWAGIIPKALQKFSKHNGNWVAAPIDFHSTNWVWINKSALDATGGKVPSTWEELVTVLDAMKANGIIPLGHGGEAWQEMTIFDSIFLSLGDDFYQSAFIDLDPKALGGAKMLEAFNRMAKLRTYVDDDFSGRDWNIVVSMVTDGKAGMQIMGDWAKGVILNAGKEADKDFVCIRFPGTQGAITFNSGQFVMFKSDNAEQQAMQKEMASSIMSEKVQFNFNIHKGSIPARTDMSGDNFDSCGQKAIKDLAQADADGRLYGSMAHGHAAPGEYQSIVYDVVTAHFNGEMTSEEAVEELVASIEDAKKL